MIELTFSQHGGTQLWQYAAMNLPCLRTETIVNIILLKFQLQTAITICLKIKTKQSDSIRYLSESIPILDLSITSCSSFVHSGFTFYAFRPY